MFDPQRQIEGGAGGPLLPQLGKKKFIGNIFKNNMWPRESPMHTLIYLFFLYLSLIIKTTNIPYIQKWKILSIAPEL